ncbi:hypothetical protein EON65_21530 [archaeon]|nr:MAG: hypothetical protein EON65_21530 [archaeon]
MKSSHYLHSLFWPLAWSRQLFGHLPALYCAQVAGLLGLRTSRCDGSYKCTAMKRKATCLRPLSNTRSVLQKNGQEVPSCPICNKSLWTDPAFSSMHIEQCLSKSSSSNSTFNERYPSTSGDVVSLLSDEEEENLPATPENALASLNAEVQKQQQTRRELWSQNAYIDQAISLGTSGDKVDDKSSSSTIVAVENPTAGTTATKRSIHSSSTQPLQSTLPLQITTFGLAATSNSSSAFCLSQISIHTIPTLPGVFIIQNFLAEEEELAIVRMLDGDVRTPWKVSNIYIYIYNIICACMHVHVHIGATGASSIYHIYTASVAQ